MENLIRVSLGVILYTVLTGYKPFQGNSAITVSFKVVNHDPLPATVLDTELPHGLDSIIERAMAKDPAERYQRGMEIVLDIQRLREGLEPWSKAKLPGLPTSRGAGQTANGRAKSSLGQPGIAAKLPSSALSLPAGHGAAENLLEKMRKKSIADVLVLAGIFIFGLWVISFGPREGPTRATEPWPLAREVALPVKTAATPAAPAASAVASVATVPTPIVKEFPKPVPADRTYPSPAKVARASSPIVSPAMLEIEVEHKFAEAHLSIWVDDRLTYTHLLKGTDKKHLGVFHHVQGHEFHAIQLSPGKHSLRVQVASDGTAYDQIATVAGEFASGQENVLQINFNKHGEINLNLQ